MSSTATQYGLSSSFRNLSIRTAISIALVVGLAAPIGTATLYDWQVRRAAQREALEHDHWETTEIIAQGLTSAVWNLEPDIGRPLLTAIMSDPRVVSVKVITPVMPVFLEAMEAERRIGDSLVFERPIVRAGENLGRVQVEMATGLLEADFASDRRRTLLLFLLQLAVSGSVIMLVLHGKIVQPVRSLVLLARRIAAGELEHDIRRDRQDEVGVLARSMDDMRRSLLELIGTLTQRNEELRQSEARFQAAVESIPDGLLILDAEDRIAFYNSKYPDHISTGMQGCLALGKTFESWIHEGVAAGWLYHTDMGPNFAERRLALRKAPFSDHEQRLIDGRWVRVRESEMAGGGRVLLTSDVTERHEHEREMRESAERLRTIAEAHPMPMIIVRLSDRQVLFANRAYLELFRVTADGLAGLACGGLCADEQDRSWLFEVVGRGEAVLNRELDLERGDGTRFTGSVTAQRIVYQEVPAMVAGAIDLTPLKAAEAEIARQREALHQGEKLAALGSLLAGVAHELNNPLSVVLGYSSLLRNLSGDQGTRQRAERIHSAADRCSRIVKTFLAMARQKPQSKGPVEINEMLGSIVEMLGYQLRTTDIDVDWQLSETLPTVWGDGDQLNQVLINLIVNAQQALQDRPTPRRLTLTTRCKGNFVVVEVTDNGPGIPAALRARIFEPFFTTKSVGVGTGLGLSVSRSIAIAHGGGLKVSEQPGGGARFTLRLPLAAAPEAAEAAGVQPQEMQPCSILVVDDEPDLRDLLMELLGQEGHTVTVASSGREAIAKLETGRFDLILSDIRMPDLDGPALYRYLKGKRSDLQPRLLFMTGDVLSADVKAFLAGVTVPVIEKPLDIEVIKMHVASATAAVDTLAGS